MASSTERKHKKEPRTTKCKSISMADSIRQKKEPDAFGRCLNKQEILGGNQNHNEISPMCEGLGWLFSKRQDITSAEEDGEKMQPSGTVGGNAS